MKVKIFSYVKINIKRNTFLQKEVRLDTHWLKPKL